MPDLTFDVIFPFPASHLELALGLRDEPVLLREYAMVIEAYDPEGGLLPKGMLNWGYSAPLGGCYQYVPDAPSGGVAAIPLAVQSDAPLGALEVKVVPWKLVGSSRDPCDTFDRLVVSYTSHDAPDAPRFVSLGRSPRG